MCPVFINIGNFVIYWYGVLIAIGVFVATYIFQQYALREGYSNKCISEIIFWVVIFGILGGRFLHVLSHFSYYQRHPFQMLAIRNGGLAVQGAVLFSFVFLLVYSSVKNLNFLKTLDLVALVAPVGQALGRIGCFLNGCCYGKPTQSFVGLKFPFLSEKVHPTELYYAACYVVLFFVLALMKKRRVEDGEIFGTYLICFGLIRYFVDFLRGDLLLNSFGLYTTQFVGTLMFLAGGIWFVFLFLRPNRHRNIKEN